MSIRDLAPNDVATFVKQVRLNENHDLAFLESYKGLLTELVKLGSVTFDGDPKPFSFVEAAKEIERNLLKHRDNIRADGTPERGAGHDVVHHLTSFAKQIASSGSTGMDAGKLRILREVLIELKHPFTTTQDTHGTCAAESVSTLLFYDNPAEWTRIAIALLDQDGTKPVPTSDPSKELRLPPDIGKWDGSEERSLVAKAIQAAILNTFAPEGWSYSNKKDKYTDKDGKQHESGMASPHDREALDALLGKEHLYRKKPSEDWFKKVSDELGTSVYTVLRWSRERGGKHAYHALTVIGYDPETKRVLFRNPHRQQDTKDGHDIDDSGPVRRAENKEQGLESMSLAEFSKRAEYALPSREAAELLEKGRPKAPEKPLEELGDVVDERHPPLRKASFGKTFLLATMGAAVVGGVAWWFAPKFSTRSEDGPTATASGGPVAGGGGAAPRISPQPGMSEDSLREQLPNRFLGAKEWQKLFGETVPAKVETPGAVSRELLSSKCPISVGATIGSSHQAILVPEGLTLEQLAEVCKEQELQLKFGSADLSADSKLNGPNGKSYWAFPLDPQSIPDSFNRQFAASPDYGGLPGALRDRFPSHRLNTAHAAILSIVMAELDPSERCPAMTALCSDRDVSGQQIGIRYEPDKRTITIDYAVRFAGSPLSVSPGYNTGK
jgi:hypothetical protein